MKNKAILFTVIAVVIVVAILLIWVIPHTSTEDSSHSAIPTASPIVEPTDSNQTIGNNNVSNVITDSDGQAMWSHLEDPDYNISIQALGPYDGPFFEDGSDDEVSGILALKFTNNSSQIVQYAEYYFIVGDTTLCFKLSDLPAGESVVVLESNRHKLNTSEYLALASRTVAQTSKLDFDSDKVMFVDNSDNSLTLLNVSDTPLPVVRVFYKLYYSDVDAYVGGITYTATAKGIPANGSVTISPAHYASGAAVIMHVGVYSE